MSTFVDIWSEIRLVDESWQCLRYYEQRAAVSHTVTLFGPKITAAAAAF